MADEATVTLTLSWFGSGREVARVLASGFWDEKVRSKRGAKDVALAEEHWLIVGGARGPERSTERILRVTVSLPSADVDRYAIYVGDRGELPSGGYVVPAALLNALPKAVAEVSEPELVRMRRERGDEWRAKIGSDSALLDALRRL